MSRRPAVFLSHAHTDKVVARRLARELRPYGFHVWVDEAELTFGAVLSTTLRAHIEASDVVLVVASAASAASRWVRLEFEHAAAHSKPVVPVYVEAVAGADVFRDHLGFDATSQFDFRAAVHRFMAALLAEAGQQLGEPDRGVLEADLRALVREEPDLGPVILGLLDGEGVGYEQTAHHGVAFHALDHALSALLELQRSERVAFTAAACFQRTGAGAAALARWIALSGDGGTPLVTALDADLEPHVTDAALKLLAACDPPNAHALYQFISKNSGHFDEQQRRRALMLVTWPQRGPAGLGDVLGGVALQHFAGAPEIVQMWRRWIRAGDFDGAPHPPSRLARSLALAQQARVPNLGELHEVLRSHVRGHVRSGDERRVEIAVRHLRANVDEKTGAVDALRRECSGVWGTAEWDDWRTRDPETAARMENYVLAFSDEAEPGGRGWSKARQAFELLEEHRRMLEGSLLDESTGQGD